MVFHGADKNDPAAFNRLTWRGVVGDTPYPETRTGQDLSYDRADVLKEYRLPVPLQ